jgi:hypothetical protein
LGDFKAKLGREDSFKPTIGNESLHQDSNDNVVRIECYPHKSGKNNKNVSERNL